MGAAEPERAERALPTGRSRRAIQKAQMRERMSLLNRNSEDASTHRLVAIIPWSEPTPYVLLPGPDLFNFGPALAIKARKLSRFLRALASLR